MTTMTYKDYEAVVDFDDEAEVFHGEVINLRDVITFQGESVTELKEAFWANHTPTARKLTCTACGHKGFCVEAWGGEEE